VLFSRGRREGRGKAEKARKIRGRGGEE